MAVLGVWPSSCARRDWWHDQRQRAAARLAGQKESGRKSFLDALPTIERQSLKGARRKNCFVSRFAPNGRATTRPLGDRAGKVEDTISQPGRWSGVDREHARVAFGLGGRPKLRAIGSGMMKFKGQGQGWLVWTDEQRQFCASTHRTFTSPGPWPLNPSFLRK